MRTRRESWSSKKMGRNTRRLVARVDVDLTLLTLKVFVGLGQCQFNQCAYSLFSIAQSGIVSVAQYLSMQDRMLQALSGYLCFWICRRVQFPFPVLVNLNFPWTSYGFISTLPYSLSVSALRRKPQFSPQCDHAHSLTSLHFPLQVTKMLGNGRLEAMCFDGTKRLCHIRGKLRKKVWINQSDIILIGLRDYQVCRYMQSLCIINLKPFLSDGME